MATITVRLNGSYKVEGDDVKLVDWNGNEYQIPKRPFSLCRCGGSANKPFFAGTHSKIGFQAAETAGAPAGGKPPPLRGAWEGEALPPPPRFPHLPPLVPRPY